MELFSHYTHSQTHVNINPACSFLTQIIAHANHLSNGTHNLNIFVDYNIEILVEYLTVFLTDRQ